MTITPAKVKIAAKFIENADMAARAAAVDDVLAMLGIEVTV